MINKIVLETDIESIPISCGQILLRENEPYIMCCSQKSENYTPLYSLISLKNGARWLDPQSFEQIVKTCKEDGFVSLGETKITIERL